MARRTGAGVVVVTAVVVVTLRMWLTEVNLRRCRVACHHHQRCLGVIITRIRHSLHIHPGCSCTPLMALFTEKTQDRSACCNDAPRMSSSYTAYTFSEIELDLSQSFPLITTLASSVDNRHGRRLSYRQL